MIEIRLLKREGSLLQIKVAGHSGYGPKGFDIVCSAVSALLLTWLGGIETELGGTVQGTIGEGLCDVRVQVPEPQSEVFQKVAGIFLRGFGKLAAEYPELVKFYS